MAREGQEFIKHEFDEAIAIQQSILECERELAQVHPLEDAKAELQQMVRADEQQLKTLQELGQQFGATGRREEVAQHMQELGSTIAKQAKQGPDSEKYEMHAVVLTMKRKQQDSAQAMSKIAQDMGDRRLQDEATRMHKETKDAAERLAKSLSTLAVDLANRGQQQAQQR